MAARKRGADDVERPGTLALRRVAIDTYRENVAYLHRECELYRAEGFGRVGRRPGYYHREEGRRVAAVLYSREV